MRLCCRRLFQPGEETNVIVGTIEVIVGTIEAIQRQKYQLSLLLFAVRSTISNLELYLQNILQNSSFASIRDLVLC